MSAILTAILDKKSFLVEITREGQIFFPNYNIEYDLAMAEFGEPETVAIRIYNRWNKHPTDPILNMLDIEIKTIVLIAADWAEHVLPIFEKEHPNDPRPRNAIQAARHFLDLDDEIGKIELIDLRESAMRAREDSATAAADAALAAAEAADTALEAKKVAAWGAMEASRVSQAAMEAAASDHTLRFDSTEWLTVFISEESWQARRFVDVMEALQAGKPWPPLKATR